MMGEMESKTSTAIFEGEDTNPIGPLRREETTQKGSVMDAAHFNANKAPPPALPMDKGTFIHRDPVPTFI